LFVVQNAVIGASGANRRQKFSPAGMRAARSTSPNIGTDWTPFTSLLPKEEQVE
jgi:hypothetical protein